MVSLTGVELLVCVLMGAGIIQGAFLAFSFWVRPSRVKNANIFLGALNFFLVITLTVNVYVLLELYHVWPNLLLWPNLSWLVLPPLLYLYFRFLLDFPKKLVITDVLHLLPLFAILLLWRKELFMSAYDRYVYFGDPANFYGTTKSMYLHRIYVVQALVYLVLSLSIINRFRIKNKPSWTVLSSRQLNMLRNILIGLLSFTAIFEVSSLFPPILKSVNPKFWYIIPIGNCVLIYSLSISYMNNPEVFLKGIMLGKPLFKSKELPQKEAQECIEKLQALMHNEKIYLNPDLSLSEISSLLQVTPRQLSNVFKKYLKSSFYDYINHFRVYEAKNLIIAGKHKQWNLVAIAMEAGFNSKSTFNRIFKKSVGCTPSEYIKMNTKLPRETAD